MSTRATIARQSEDNTFIGRYSHNKSDDTLTWKLQKEINLTNLSEAMSEMMETCPIAGVAA